jgi:hypothetical protein
MFLVGIAMCVISGYGMIQILADTNNNEDKIKIRLSKLLECLCNQFKINLAYCDSFNDSALGKIIFNNINGQLIMTDIKIEILQEYKNEPFVLAHELGHYISIKQRHDDSEQSADREGLKICRELLTPKEQTYLNSYFEKYF